MFLIQIFSLFLFAGCIPSHNSVQTIEPVSISIQQSKQDVREIAFSHLTPEDKEKIAGSWQDSKLSKITLREYMGIINDKSYIGKEVYVIDIQTTSNAIPNNMIAFISMDNYKLIGRGIVE